MRPGRCASRWVGCVAALAAVLTIGGPWASGARAERVDALRLLPQNTVVLVRVADVPDLARRFTNTALGQMSADKLLSPVVWRLRDELAAAINQSRERIGLEFSELVGLVQGEAVVAVVAQDDKPPALVALLDVGAHKQDAERLLEQLGKELESSGARRAEERVAGTTLRIYEDVGRRQGRVGLALRDETMVLGTDAELLRGLLADWQRGAKEPLADEPRLRTICERFRLLSDEEPQVLFYVDPLGLLRAAFQGNPAMELSLALLPALGLDGVEALGGTLALDSGAFDSVLDVHLLLDPPRAGVLKVIALEGGAVEPERWVPAKTMTYTTLHWNFPQSFAAGRTVYDAFRGEGALSRDMSRPFERLGIDFEKDLLPELDGRVTLLGWSDPAAPPGPPRPERVLALKLRDTKRMAELLARISARNEAMIEPASYAGKEFYAVRVLPQRPEQPRGPIPSEAPPQVAPPSEQLPQPTPPSPCFGLLDDYLVMTSDRRVYEELILTARSNHGLADELEFKLILSKARRLAGTEEPVWLSFRRPELQMRTLYEWVASERFRQRAARLAESNRFWKAVDAALADYPLPRFEALAHYFAPGGAVLADDGAGLHYTSFTLRRNND